MTGHTPFTAPSAAQPLICLACTEGDHERVLGTECCSCPCHGQADLIAAVEVAA